MCSEVFNNISDVPTSDYGIRIYKNRNVYRVDEEETRQRWNLLVFETSLRVKGLGVLESGIYVTPSSSPMAETDYGKGFKGYLLSIPSDSWKILDIYDLEALSRSSHFVPYHKMSTEEAGKVMCILNLIRLLLDSDDCCGKMEELTYLCWALMATLVSFYKKNNLFFPRTSSVNKLTNNFIRLVNEHCPKEKKLSFYASKLGTTPKYLSSVVSKTTGKKANHWICERTIKKSKELLMTTSYSVDKISRLTCFPSSSVFCRYFRSHTGMTPAKYRNMNQFM